MTEPVQDKLVHNGFPFEIPFLTDLGVEFVSSANGEAELRLALLPRHMNSWQVAHGGVVMTLLDVAMAQAGRSLYENANVQISGGVTVEMKTTFVRPSAGAVLIAKGRCYHRSTTLAFCEADVLDEQGRVCAKSSGTFKYLSGANLVKRKSAVI